MTLNLSTKATFWEHLEDLRKCIIKIVIVISSISLFCFIFGLKEYDFFGLKILLPLNEYRLFGHNLILPYFEINNNIASMVFDQIRNDLVPNNVELIMIKPIDAIMANIQISLFLGIILGMPIIVTEIGEFILPALYAHERRLILFTVIPASALFIMGAMFAYFLMIPFFMDFLYGYGDAMGVHTFLSIDEFISFVLIITLGFGLIFELPVFMAALTKFGVVTPKFWKRHWRIAVVIMIVIGGFITPDASGITQMMVAFPMMFLYLIGYVISKRMYDKNNNDDLEDEEED